MVVIKVRHSKGNSKNDNKENKYLLLMKFMVFKLW